MKAILTMSFFGAMFVSCGVQPESQVSNTTPKAAKCVAKAGSKSIDVKAATILECHQALKKLRGEKAHNMEYFWEGVQISADDALKEGLSSKECKYRRLSKSDGTWSGIGSDTKRTIAGCKDRAKDLRNGSKSYAEYKYYYKRVPIAPTKCYVKSAKTNNKIVVSTVIGGLDDCRKQAAGNTDATYYYRAGSKLYEIDVSKDEGQLMSKGAPAVNENNACHYQKTLNGTVWLSDKISLKGCVTDRSDNYHFFFNGVKFKRNISIDVPVLVEAK